MTVGCEILTDSVMHIYKIHIHTHTHKFVRLIDIYSLLTFYLSVFTSGSSSISPIVLSQERIKTWILACSQFFIFHLFCLSQSTIFCCYNSIFKHKVIFCIVIWVMLFHYLNVQINLTVFSSYSAFKIMKYTVSWETDQ